MNAVRLNGECAVERRRRSCRSLQGIRRIIWRFGERSKPGVG